MPIKTSGQLAFTEIVAEFPDNAPHSMNEFYRGGGKVPDSSSNTNIPTSGAISFNNFYGTANRVIREITISTNQQNYVFDPSKISAYNAGSTDAIININEGVYIWSDSNVQGALIVSGWASGDTVKVVNKGFIIGKGGEGGPASRAPTGNISSQGGTVGGPAIKVIGNVPITVNTSWPTSYVAGGGGGGASSYYGGLFSAGGGGAGGGKGGNITDSANPGANRIGGAGGVLGAVGAGGPGDNDLYNSGAGGGRILPGVGGQASLSTTEGRSVGGGAGGTGAWSDGRNYAAQVPNGQGAAGGAGGGWGALGTPGWFSNNNQLSNFMPSYGNGGSADAIGGYPSGCTVDLNTGVVTVTRPVTGWFTNQSGGIFGFTLGGYAVALGGGTFSLELSNSRPGGIYAGFYGAIGFQV